MDISVFIWLGVLFEIIIFFAWLLWKWLEHDNRTRHKESEYRAEQARKKAAFDALYASIPPHEQYMVDQQRAQSNTMRSIAAGMLANNIHDFMDPPGYGIPIRV